MLDKIWQAIAATISPPGQQRSLTRNPIGFDASSSIWRQWDLEISEYPIRDVDRARKLIEMCEYCPEIGTAINEISDSTWSSDDGDDQGFALADTLNDNQTLIDPAVKRILKRLIEEVLGGITLEPATERMLSYGDAFASIGINPKTMQIEQLLFLPTWEMFRIEDNQGKLWRFDQRQHLSADSQTSNSAIAFHPLTICHWRYRKKTLYGRSLFYESTLDWDNLKAATQDLAAASRAIGINPNIHLMPDIADEDYRAQYKQAYEEKKRLGIVTDFYLMYGADIRKLAQINPDLKAMSDNVLQWRSRIVMRSRVPPYLLGLPSIGAREIAGQPALAYARFINRIRMSITQGIKQICNLELALAGIPKEKWQYRIIWPRIAINPYGTANLSTDTELNNLEIEDIE